MDMKDWQIALKPYTIKSNTLAVWQLAITFMGYFALWFLYIKTIHVSAWLVIPFSLMTSLFVIRLFVLMHDCGHGALFSSGAANKFFGYVTGVITGMPQYVWSKHHAHHHATNGNWEKYRGPLTTISVAEYAALNRKQQKFYWRSRHPSLLLYAGFHYVLFSPRFNWLAGSLRWLFEILLSLNPFSNRSTWSVIKECQSKYWKTPKEFRHMTYNNVTLISLWILLCQSIGTFNFFIFYVPTLCLSGGLGIVLFMVQHNFEHSYATDTENVDYCKAAIKGTSYLILPKFLDWFTADIAYHHIHHLSTAVPNYRLAACHEKFKDLFADVKRISLKEIPKSLRYQIWDAERQMLISEAEYRQSYG